MAFSLIVSVVMSTALSTKVSVPVAGCASVSCGTAMTDSGSPLMCFLIVWRWTAGTVNVTNTGCTRAIVISSVWFACDEAADLHARALPVRPSIAERITV